MKNKKNFLLVWQDWEGWLSKRFETFERWCTMDGFDLKKDMYLVIALSKTEKHFFPRKNIEVFYIKSTPLKQLLDLAKLKLKIKEKIPEFNPDYIYTPFTYLGSAVPKTRVPLVIFQREKTPESIKAKGGIIRKIAALYVKHLDKKAFSRASIVLHNGKSMAEYARELGFKGKLVYAPRPILNKEFFNKAKPDKIIRKYNLKGKKVLLTVSRLTEEKNIELQIKALKYLPEKYALVVVGEGHLKDKLKAIAKTENVKNKVHFAGYVKHKNIWQYYKVADVFLLTSKTDFEGTANAIVEAMYSGVPVVASNIKGNRNIVKNRKNGILVPVENPEKLAKSILKAEKEKKTFIKEGFETIKKIIKKRKKIKDILK